MYPSQKQIEAREKRLQAVEEEEADTDIEEPVNTTSRSPKKSLSFGINETPAGQSDKHLSTPKAPRFAASAITPPTTVRATRSKKVDMGANDSSEDEYPSTPVHGTPSRTANNRSPFFSDWQRVKHDDETKATKKRGGESMARGSTGKRARN